MKPLLSIACVLASAVVICSTCLASVTASPRVVVCGQFLDGTDQLTDESILAVSQFAKRMERHPIGVGDLQIFLVYGADSKPRSEADQEVLTRRRNAATHALARSWSASSPVRSFEVQVHEWPATAATAIPALGECGAIFQADYWGDPPGSPCERSGHCYVVCSSTYCRER